MPFIMKVVKSYLFNIKEIKAMEVVSTNNAPAAIGPYSQAIKVGNLVFCSGQIPVDPATGNVPETVAEQAEQSCRNVKALVEAAGSSMEKVLKTTCFLSDINDFAAFNEVYAKYFVSNPARSCVAVKDIPKGVKCEIEAIAEL
jgi:reactive intermediate/imine deaminase